MLCGENLLSPPPAAAQDTVRLGALQAAAVAHDPRARQLELQREATTLRLEELSTERLPQLRVTGQAAYQSDVTSIPVHVPGLSIPTPPQDRYQATLNADQLVFDGGAIARRRALEQAQLAEREAGVRTQLFALRDQVSQSFFAAYLLQARLGEVATLVTDLEARLALLRAQVRAGTALPGDSAAVLAELLSADENRAALEADRSAALEVLSRLTGRTVADSSVLALPDLSAKVAEARTAGGAASVRDRPEYATFQRTRERLARQESVVASKLLPRVSAFGQAGYGRPGLDQFSRSFQGFWTAGVELQWQPWDWGSVRRQREELEVEQRVVATEEAAFTEGLGRQVQSDLAAMDRLRATLETDDRIVALREQVERQARAQLVEHAIPAAQYVDRRTDVLQAQLTRDRHRVELAQAQAHYLTTLGVALR